VDCVNQSPLTSHGSADFAGIGARQRNASERVVTRALVSAWDVDWITYPVCVSWAFWGDVTIVLAVVGFVWGVIRWVIPRVRRRAAPPVEPTTPPAVQPPPQIPPAQIVYVSSPQAPTQGGAATTIPGPATALGTQGTNFQTFGLTDASDTAPRPTFGPGVTGLTPDDRSAEDRP
jgi:hypothetical protein